MSRFYWGATEATRALKVPEECECTQLLQNILRAMLAFYPNGSSRRKEMITFSLCLCHLPNRLPYSVGSNWKFGQMGTTEEYRTGCSVWAIIKTIYKMEWDARQERNHSPQPVTLYKPIWTSCRDVLDSRYRNARDGKKTTRSFSLTGCWSRTK